LYASGAVRHLQALLPGFEYYGCAGPKLQAAGVEPVVHAGDISVVGLTEVVGHLPRIYGQYRRLLKYARRNRPAAALLTDNPDFNLRLARHLKRMGVPIFYLVAPQVWAWRQGRVKAIRELVDRLFCLFPFEEPWFRERGVDATYIGHPLASMVRAAFSRHDFLQRHGLPGDPRVLVLLPGSRSGEVERHMPVLLDAVARLRSRFELTVILATPKGFQTQSALLKFRERMAAQSIQVIENETWDCISHAHLALAASGTVTMEAAMVGTPMVTFYRVNPLSWHAGRRLVKAPFLSMVNLIANEQIVPELIQDEMTAAKVSAAAAELLTSDERMNRMRADLARVRHSLTPAHDPLQRAAALIAERLREGSPRSSETERELVQETIN
jgi:lipid-A-disaccharide synthase